MTNGVAMVTGASRGLGRGIARALGRRGMTVYITGRASGGDALDQVALEIDAAGGKGIAVRCDHAVDTQVQVLFEGVRNRSGRLDILVNNAAAVHVDDLSAAGPFWEKRLRLVDMIDVGLRSNYVASYYAAPLLIQTGAALVVHISFYGAVCYFHGPAYGAAKAGTDKMAFDMAFEFKPHDVASVSFWPGFVETEALAAVPLEMLPPRLAALVPDFESPEFSGMVIERLWRDPERMVLSGKSLVGAGLGLRYGISDINGRQPRIYADSLGEPDGRFRIAGPEWPV